MKKMTTLFKKDPNNLGRVIDEINLILVEVTLQIISKF